ncbi:MAG: hypothetical protein ABI284_07265, partial [Nitrosospira sp.]
MKLFFDLVNIDQNNNLAAINATLLSSRSTDWVAKEASTAYALCSRVAGLNIPPLYLGRFKIQARCHYNLYRR